MFCFSSFWPVYPSPFPSITANRLSFTVEIVHFEVHELTLTPKRATNNPARIVLYTPLVADAFTSAYDLAQVGQK